MYAWKNISDKIFNILIGSGYTVKMFDKAGMKTVNPEEATRFFATTPSSDPTLSSYTILVALHDENANSHIDIKIPKIENDKDFAKTLQTKNHIQKTVGDDEGISINWHRFDHAINPKDEVVNNIAESQDISKAYGTTKSSYQKVGNAKLIVRHTTSVDESVRGSRWRKIHAIFIENKEGERIKFDWPHVNGARAMARHISNEGTFYDKIGQQIQRLSEEYSNLKCAARIFRKNEYFLPYLESVTKSMKDLQSTAKSISLPKGYSNKAPMLSEEIDTISKEDIFELQSKLIEQCKCDIEDDKTISALGTAAKFILKNEKPEEPLEEDDSDDIQRLQELSGIII
jgi:hypothetical protein